MDKESFEKIVRDSVSKSDVCRKLGWHGNGTYLKKVTALLDEFEIDSSHFSHKAAINLFQRKYDVIKKPCPVCKKEFETQKGHSREKETCSHACSNTFFRAKRNKPEKYTRYRTICFSKWEKKCLICGYDRVIDVHHFDENHDNNDIHNLVPLCPNHHKEIGCLRYKQELNELLSELLKKRNVA